MTDDEARRPQQDAGSTERDEVRRAEREHRARLDRDRRRRAGKLVALLTLSLLLVIFIVANAQPVAVDFVFTTRSPRLIWVMIACAAIGGVVGYLIARPGKGIRLHDEESPPEDRRPSRDGG